MGKMMGLDKDWASAHRRRGNYGEIFEANIGEAPRSVWPAA
jgi:hypothetical protein